ncbi:MAG: hypothetical protein QOF01_4793 [Thermomicrobiales bacterium]|nr:hypothetical protein [Thermomicrobiales bacterium]
MVFLSASLGESDIGSAVPLLAIGIGVHPIGPGRA